MRTDTPAFDAYALNDSLNLVDLNGNIMTPGASLLTPAMKHLVSPLGSAAFDAAAQLFSATPLAFPTAALESTRKAPPPSKSRSALVGGPAISASGSDTAVSPVVLRSTARTAGAGGDLGADAGSSSANAQHDPLSPASAYFYDMLVRGGTPSPVMMRNKSQLHDV